MAGEKCTLEWLEQLVSKIKEVKNLGLLGGSAFALVSGLQFASYYSQPDSYELDVLHGAAAYLQQYGEEDPREVLDYANATLERAAQGNLSLPELVGLERELAEMQEAVENSPMPGAYRVSLERLGKKIEEVADEHGRDGTALGLGILFGSVALWWWGLVYYAKRKTRDDKDT
ncbi:MAG TPA: hypothetical protein VJC21_06045 [Candidatus Nanoarchaeia archaeon]|nr:hypothetical protein [Candidatus Nanoarchaeia archaeon]